MSERLLNWCDGGVSNPDGHLACGAKDPNAKFPEPVHWGGCKTCHKKLVELLSSRAPQRAKARPPKQAEFVFDFDGAE